MPVYRQVAKRDPLINYRLIGWFPFQAVSEDLALLCETEDKAQLIALKDTAAACGY